MSRSPRRPARKQQLNELMLQRLRPAAKPFLIWDTYQRGLVLSVQPTGAKAWKVIYRSGGRPRWLHLGPADAIGLADARRLAGRRMVEVAEGKDPAAEKKADRNRGTFAELAERYVEQHAKKKNKSWRQGETLVRRYALPGWTNMPAAAVTRADVKALIGGIDKPVLANQVLASVSAIFTWAVREDILPANPCKLVARNAVRSRERVLEASELPQFWSAFDDAGLVIGTALKVLLLTGQRPGEVANMRREHIRDGWWEIPGAPVPALRWPGTKNGESHRVWLPAPVQTLLRELSDDDMLGGTGYVFTSGRRRLDHAMRAVCSQLDVARATPHDLRRTHGTTITGLGKGRDAMNRIQNHREGGIADVYDRHGYEKETKDIMEAVAAHLMALATGQAQAGNVVPLKKATTP